MSFPPSTTNNTRGSGRPHIYTTISTHQWTRTRWCCDYIQGTFTMTMRLYWSLGRRNCGVHFRGIFLPSLPKERRLARGSGVAIAPPPLASAVAGSIWRVGEQLPPIHVLESWHTHETCMVVCPACSRAHSPFSALLGIWVHHYAHPLCTLCLCSYKCCGFFLTCCLFSHCRIHMQFPILAAAGWRFWHCFLPLVVGHLFDVAFLVVGPSVGATLVIEFLYPREELGCTRVALRKTKIKYTL